MKGDVEMPKGRKRSIADNSKKNYSKNELIQKKAEEKAATENFESIQMTPPSWLDDMGKREYRRVINQLQKLHITSLDMTALSFYCNAYSKYRQASEDIDDRGLYIDDEMSKKNPSMSIMESMSKEVRSYVSSLGMTLDSRMKLVAPNTETKPEDPFDEFED